MRYPDIFAYEDYRPFLRDWFKARKKITGRKGTSAFARLAGCVPGHVQNVISGRRKLQQELVPGFCQGLELNADGSEFLALLVRRVHPLSPADRSLAEGLLRQARARHQALGEGASAPRGRPRRAAGPTAQIAPPWSHPVIRALLATEGAREQQGWVAAALTPAISPIQASQALDLLGQGAEGGRAARPEEAWTLRRLDPRSATSVSYHRDAIAVARWGLHNSSAAATRFRASVWPVPSAQLPRLLDEIAAFEAEVQDIFTRAAAPTVRPASGDRPASDEPVFERHGPPDVIYQITAQLLPISARMRRDREG